MKKGLLIAAAALMIAVTGCSSESTQTQPTKPSTVKLQLDAKHTPFPDFVKKSSAMVQETYVMASADPKALSAAPCYCGCYETDGHTSVQNCFVSQLGPNGEVKEWDPMGVG